MSRIFISYRTEDSPGYLGRLKQTLETRVRAEDIFAPGRDIEGGALFPNEIKKAVRDSQALVVLIGRYWLTRPNGERRDLASADDFVRLEIVTALENDVKVIPILVGDAQMPKVDELPTALRPLASLQALPLSDSSWPTDCERLFKAIGVTAISVRDATAGSAMLALRRRLLPIAFAGVLMATAAYWIATGWGQEPLPVSTILSLDVDRSVMIQTPGNVEIPIDDSVSLTIRPEQTVRVDISRPNPLLFTYKLAGIATETNEYASAIDFATQLAALLGDMAMSSSAASDVRPLTVRGIGFDRLREDLNTISYLSNSIPGDLAASLGGPSSIEALKKKYRDADVGVLARRIGEALVQVASIVKACESAGALLATDDGSPIRCDGPAVIGLNVELTAGRMAYPTKLRPTLIEFVRAVHAMGPPVRRQLDMLQALSSDVGDLGNPRTIITARYSDSRQALTVMVGPQSKYERSLDAETRRKRDDRLRKMTLMFEPD